jgi:hypothetical protein
VVDRFPGLRHDAVVGRHHGDHEVGDFGSACPHGGERLVTRRIQECDATVVHLDGVRADVLGDAPSLTRRHVGFADRVEERGLAVVDVTHDRHHGRPLREVLLGILVHRLLGLLLRGADDLDLLVERRGQGCHRVIGQGLGERRHLAQLHQLLDHLRASQAERLGHLTHRGSGMDLGRW